MNRQRFSTRLLLGLVLLKALAACSPEITREAPPPVAVHESPQSPVDLAPR